MEYNHGIIMRKEADLFCWELEEHVAVYMYQDTEDNIC